MADTDNSGIKRRSRIRIKRGWSDEGQVGKALHKPVMVAGQFWVPVEWDHTEDPDFIKLAAVERYTYATLRAEQKGKKIEA